MSDFKHRGPGRPKPPGAGKSPGSEPEQDRSALDIEPDALLDSLLADPDPEPAAAGAEPADLGDDDEDEVTGVARPPPGLASDETRAGLPEEFSEVD